MSEETKRKHLEWKLARAESAGDLKRASELRKELGLPPKAEPQPKAAKTEDKPQAVSLNPKKGKKTQGEKKCLCGCGEMTKSTFKIGHDGRASGQIRRVLTKKMKESELDPGIRGLMKKWVKAGKPGGEMHPKLKDLA